MKKREKDEGPTVRLKITRKAFIPIYFFALLLVAVPTTLSLLKYSVSGWLWIVSGIVLLLGVKIPELERFMTTYTITPSAVIVEKGFISQRRTYRPLSIVTDVDLKQTAWQRILNYGSLTIKTFQGDVEIGNINAPETFIPMIEEHVAASANMTDSRREKEEESNE